MGEKVYNRNSELSNVTLLIFFLLLLLVKFNFATSESYDNNSSTTTDGLPICDGIGYNFGKWVPRNFTENPSQNFACCGGGIQNSLVCKDKTIPINEEHGCSCEARYYKDNNFSPESNKFIPQSVNYDWKPDNCHLAGWDGNEFCKLLGKKKMLLIGDSTMYQTYTVVANMIIQTNTSDQYLRTCASQLQHKMSDIPLGLPLPPQSRGRGNSILTTVANEWKEGRHYDIIIFSLGFHIHGLIKPDNSKLNVTDQSYADYLSPRLMEQLDNIRSIYKFSGLEYPTLIYKTDNMPHSNCQAQYGKGPQEELDNREGIMNLNKDSKYMWNKEFGLEDHIIHACNERKVPVLRMYPLYSRSDGHPLEECLHYCTPGPLNILGRLLLHFLKTPVAHWMHNGAGKHKHHSGGQGKQVQTRRLAFAT